MWPWEMYELLNLAAAVERAASSTSSTTKPAYYPMSLAFTRLSPVPVSRRCTTRRTLRRSRSGRAIPRRRSSRSRANRRDSSRAQRRRHRAARRRHGALHVPRPPEDYLLFLGRFTPGKGPLQAIEIARRAGLRLMLAAAENQYYREAVAPLVDGQQIVYVGEVGLRREGQAYGGARALLYPVQAGEPFGLVLTEAMACGTPVAALNKGAVREIVDDGVTGGVFDDLEDLAKGLMR